MAPPGLWYFFNDRLKEEQWLNSANIYDVAREANVSIATVSRVLNNNPRVSRTTRDRVLETLHKMNYQPSEIARGLVAKKMQTVGILTVDIRSSNNSITAYTIERNLSMLGYNSMLCNTFGNEEDNIKYVRMLMDKGVSGIVCIGSVFDRTFNGTSLLSECKSTPIILTNYQVEADNVCSVLIDDRSAIQSAIDHLVERGHKDIVFVRDMGSFSSNQKAKFFKNYMEKCGLPFGSESIFVTDRSLSGGAAAVDGILASGVKFSAIIFNDDVTAIGGMKQLKRLGYSTPEDVAIIGYNNTTAAECCTPALTSVDNKFETVGNIAVTLLRDLLDGNNTSKCISIVPELVVREST